MFFDRKVLWTNRAACCLLSTIQVKAFADFVHGAGRPGEAFVKKKFLCDKAGKPRLVADPGFQGVEPWCSAPAFAARQSDVRTVGVILGNESAEARGCGDMLLKREQFGRDGDTGKEDSGAIEETHRIEFDRNGRRAQFAQSRDDTFVLRLGGVTKKLQGDVP